MSCNRRLFLKSAGAAGLALASAPAHAARASDPNTPAVLVDTTRCIGCRGCELACAEANGLPEPPDPPGDIFAARRETSTTQFTVVNRSSVKAKGVTFVGSATVNRALSGSLGYTYTRSEGTSLSAGGYENLPGIPQNQVDASFDVHPVGKPFGISSTINFVGKTLSSAPGFGAVSLDGYALVDLSGRYFLDSSRRHRLNIRLENLFDKAYTTVPGRGFTDDGSSAFLIHNLGTPRTFHMSYSFAY